MFLKTYQPSKPSYGDPEPVPYVNVVNGKAKISGYNARLIGKLYAAGMPLTDIEADYNLTPAEIFAAVSYYYDFKDIFDAEDQAADQRFMANISQPAVAAVGASSAAPAMTVIKNPHAKSMNKVNYAPRKRK
jgi:uncharacterized protein (DUF433 family)